MHGTPAQLKFLTLIRPLRNFARPFPKTDSTELANNVVIECGPREKSRETEESIEKGLSEEKTTALTCKGKGPNSLQSEMRTDEGKRVNLYKDDLSEIGEVSGAEALCDDTITFKF